MELFGWAVRDIAAFWGAALATILALAKLAHPRPVVLLDFVRPKFGGSDLRLTMTNTATYPVMLLDVWAPKRVNGETAIQTGSIEGWVTYDVVAHVMQASKLNILLLPGKSMKLHYTLKSDPPGRLLFVLRWRSHRFIAWPMFPTILYRSKAAARALAAHPAKDIDL